MGIQYSQPDSCEWAHAGMQSAAGPKDEDDELGKTVTRVTKLMGAKEISKGASAVWGTRDRVPPQEIEQQFATAQHVADHNMPVRQRAYSLEEQQRISAFAERVGHRISKSSKQLFKTNGPGPAGGRFEQWQSVGDDDVISARLGQVLARLAIDDIPEEASSALLSAKLNGIRKDNGGCRVL